MSVFLISDSCFFTSRSCSGLTYDEKLALWTVRHLFGPLPTQGRGRFSLRAFFGRDIEPVLSLAATIYIAGINALSSTMCNQEEIALLALLEKEQNEPSLTCPQNKKDLSQKDLTKKDLILKHISALLAGRGCWLPHHYNKEEFPLFRQAVE